MLSDYERKTLREIQRQLLVEDPNFERSFRAIEAPASRSHRERAYTAGIVIAALLAVVGLLVGSPGGVLAFSLIAVSVWFAKHHRDGDAAGEPESTN